jgi:hypothetical protein
MYSYDGLHRRPKSSNRSANANTLLELTTIGNKVAGSQALAG